MPDGTDHWFAVVEKQTMPDGRIEVTYSLAPAVRRTIVLQRTDDQALAIQAAGEMLAAQYSEGNI